MEAEQIYAKILADYCKDFDVELPTINILLTDNMGEAYLAQRPDHVDKVNSNGITANTHGLIIPPAEMDEPFTILLNKSYVVESIKKCDASWIGTIVHEATHIIDYIEYAKIVGAMDYDTICNKKIPSNRCFHIWTEFNAKVKGYYFVLKYTPNYVSASDEEKLEFVTQKELPCCFKAIYEKSKSDACFDDLLYDIAHLLGRLYVWEKNHLDYFTTDKISEILQTSKMMQDLYCFLKTHTTLAEADNDFCEMDKMLKQDVFNEE